MLNIVIPMAGEGSRFADAGYVKPKPFIDVNGEPMIVKVLKNLESSDANFFLIARSEHLKNNFDLVKEIEQKYSATFIPIEKLTEGTACTVLYARKYIDNDTPLLIANSDQLVDIDTSTFIEDCLIRKLNGSILTFIDKNKDPKWSFAKIDQNNLVTEVKEKVAISELATVGIYFYEKGKYFVSAALDMIIQNDRVKGEFYTCPTYNYMIGEGRRIGIFNIDIQKMHCIGTPDDLNKYISFKKISKI